VQLPTTSIQAFHDAVNWSQPDAASQANGLARGMVLSLIREYRRGGNVALGVYRDKGTPARVADQFEAMVSQSASLPNVLPELRDYLLRYPDC
jgi:alpha-D-ribose 1-methylphosphonate 5-triphosphate synthase subunit PhnL